MSLDDGASSLRVLKAIRDGAISQIRNLCLRDSFAIYQEGAKILGEALAVGSCTKLEELDLRHCLLGDEGIHNIL